MCNMDVHKSSEILVKKVAIGKMEHRNKGYNQDTFYLAIDHIPS